MADPAAVTTDGKRGELAAPGRERRPDVQRPNGHDEDEDGSPYLLALGVGEDRHDGDRGRAGTP